MCRLLQQRRRLSRSMQMLSSRKSRNFPSSSRPDLNLHQACRLPASICPTQYLNSNSHIRVLRMLQRIHKSANGLHTTTAWSPDCPKPSRRLTLAPKSGLHRAGKEAVPHSKAPESKGPSSAHASSAKRVGSGSPPPWAHLAGPNAVFRPAVGSREPTPPAASVPTPKPSAAPARHSTAPAKAPAGQPREPPPSTVSQGSDSAQAAVREPSKQNGALGCSRGGTPEPRLQSQPPPKHAADQPRTAQPRQQRLPQHASDRSHAGTPEPPGQAPKQPAGQPVPPHTHTGKPPLRPASGSSRDPTPDEARPSSKGGTPDSVDLSSSSGPSSLKSSRDNTPQPGTGSQPLSRPNPLGRPGSAPTLPGRLGIPGSLLSYHSVPLL